MLSVQGAPVPANLLSLPEDSFADEPNKWLLRLQADMKRCCDPCSGVDVDPVIVDGDPAEDLQAALTQVDVITTTHGRSRLTGVAADC